MLTDVNKGIQNTFHCFYTKIFNCYISNG